MPGHQVMVQVQGSWFPLIAMNPQTWVENQNTATADAYKPQKLQSNLQFHIWNCRF